MVGFSVVFGLTIHCVTFTRCNHVQKKNIYIIYIYKYIKPVMLLQAV